MLSPLIHLDSSFSQIFRVSKSTIEKKHRKKTCETTLHRKKQHFRVFWGYHHLRKHPCERLFTKTNQLVRWGRCLPGLAWDTKVYHIGTSLDRQSGAVGGHVVEGRNMELRGVSCAKMAGWKNRGTPKSSILIGFTTINHPFLGYPYFWKHPLRNTSTENRFTTNCWIW